MENKVVVAAPPPPLAGWRAIAGTITGRKGEDCYYSFIRLKGRGSAWVTIIIIAMFPGSTTGRRGATKDLFLFLPMVEFAWENSYSSPFLLVMEHGNVAILVASPSSGINSSSFPKV